MSTDFIIQLYEIQTPQEAELLVEMGVDHCGSVILDADRWKDAGLRDTVRCVQKTGARSSLIPLCRQRDTILRMVDYYRPDILHFCESLADQDALESALDLQSAIRRACPELQLMRSLPIAPPGMADRIDTLGLARQFEPLSDFFLTDTFFVGNSPSGDANTSQPVSGYIGITGCVCDWQTARRLVTHCRIPVILAGGIGPVNVAAGIGEVRPAGVDSCTGTNAVNESGGAIRFRKDPQKVRELVRIVRQIQIEGKTG
jgi:phosphoribosylanthranilate isomerase